MQLILCHSQNLPLHIVSDVFDSLLLIINSTEKMIKNYEGKVLKLTSIDDQKQIIGELIKNICLAILNWDLKQPDEHYGVKKHQEELILIKSQEVAVGHSYLDRYHLS